MAALIVIKLRLSTTHLVSVDESLADGESTRGGGLEVHADERAWHGWVARQEQRLALLEEAGEAVTDGVGAQVGTVVAHTHHDVRRLIAACINKTWQRLRT